MVDIKPIEEQLNTPTLLRTINDTISFAVSVRVPDTDAANSAKYGTFFIAPFPCVLVRAYERHGTAGTDAGAVTLDVEKLTNGTAKGSGVSMLASTFNLKSTANTYVLKDPSTGVTSGTLNRALSLGQAVALKTSGTLTAVNDVIVTLVFKTDLSNLPV
jgi:hypothetical protein